MATIRETESGFVYVTEDLEIPLFDGSYQAFQHRLLPYVQMDWIGVQDPRDEEWFSHFRYDQPKECFDEMMDLARRIGTYILSDTPYDHVITMFDRCHQVQEDEFDQLLEDES